MNDSKFMKMALDLSLKGQGYTSPNPMVGAVVVKDGEVVGTGYHQAAGEPHAEVHAINSAGIYAKGSTLYVTLEPCNHEGRTPPCTEKILKAGIKEVVVTMKDPNPDVKGGGIEYLKQHGIDVRLGICEEEARKINEFFIKYVQTKRPFIIVKCAATLDGQIATKTGDSKWITGKESRKFVHGLRHRVDAIMVGIKTVIRDNPRLTTRLDNIKGHDPIRVILDTHLSISEEANLLRVDSESDTIVFTGNSVPQDKKLRIEKTGARVLAAAVIDNLIDLDLLMDQLGALGITSLLIEGGSRIIASAFRAGIVDKLFFYFAPKILGGNDGYPICMGPGTEFMNECISVKDIKVWQFGDDVMIEGYIANL